MTTAEPVFAECFRSFPARPVIDVAETPWTRDELDARIDYWMDLLARFVRAGEIDARG